jgi:chemotaxis protein MotB
MESEQTEKSENSFEQNSVDYFYEEILSFPEERQQNRWSVSWADLMMTMFIFFAVMYIYQAGNKNIKFGYGAAQNTLSEQGSGTVVNINTQRKSMEVFDQTRQAIQEVMIDEKITIDLVNDNAVKIILASDLLFDLGRAELKLGAKYQLDQLAKVLNENEYMINVGGHTDDTPTNSEIYPTNWELSSQRAVMVARYLIEIGNVDEGRIFITAHSYHQPVRPNDTVYNRSLNRRVELILSRQK